jgi:two-component system, chemotaxis family, protein-glutamate methylesterase/glutaminase
MCLHPSSPELGKGSDVSGMAASDPVLAAPPIRVLIIDDSATMRGLIRRALSVDGRLLVVGEAADPIDARTKIKMLLPDVLTLDVEMPQMSGLEFLARLMRLRPMPVVMLSSETQLGSAAAVEALSLGAVDCIGKPVGQLLADSFPGLADSVAAAVSARPRVRSDAVTPVQDGGFGWNGRYVLIGASTGGVDAIETVLAGFPADCPPTLITQHMPAPFLNGFARRLHERVRPVVTLAAEGAPLVPGRIYLAPGGDWHLALQAGQPPRCRLVQGGKVGGHVPSVGVMMASALPIAAHIVAIMLTGMGRDGAQAMADLRAAGATCLVQDEATSVVYGMPRAAAECGGADLSLPLDRIADAALGLCRQPLRRE